MLEGQYGGRHEYCDLFVVAGGFECRTYGNFGFPETHVAADEPVHRAFAFHVGFHFGCGFYLVWSIFVNERCFEFLLQERVGRESESLFFFTGGIELYQVAGNLFHLAFRLLFHAFPSTASQFVDTRSFSLFCPVFRQFVQGVNTDKNNIVVLVSQFNDLLHFSVDFGMYQSPETTYTVIHMHDVVADFYLVELFQGKSQFP